MEIIDASYRDPSGFVLKKDNKIFRYVDDTFSESFRAVQTAKIIEQSIDANFLIHTQCVPKDQWDNITTFQIPPHALLRHASIPFVSYPYEWTFSQLKHAALFHLNFHLFLLERGFHLKDASAYNIQFMSASPIFIDALSIVPYVDGQKWEGYQQFCEQFLNPLLFTQKTNVLFQDFYRGEIEGLSTSNLLKLLKPHQKFNWRVFTFLMLQEIANKKTKKQSDQQIKAALKKTPTLSKPKLRALLLQLRDWIQSMNLQKKHSTWSDYSENNTYNQEQEKQKHKIVHNFIQRHSIKTVCDLGCNACQYTKTSLKAGADFVVGCDGDLNALEKAYKMSVSESLNILPLYMNLANTSPAQGWKGTERLSFHERCHPQGLLALALVHHLAIGNNIPLLQIAHWFTELAPKGLIEFVPKQDPTVQKMLINRDDIFPNYTSQKFIDALGRYARVKETIILNNSHRIFIAYEV